MPASDEVLDLPPWFDSSLLIQAAPTKMISWLSCHWAPLMTCLEAWENHRVLPIVSTKFESMIRYSAPREDLVSRALFPNGSID